MTLTRHFFQLMPNDESRRTEAPPALPVGQNDALTVPKNSRTGPRSMD